MTPEFGTLLFGIFFGLQMLYWMGVFPRLLRYRDPDVVEPSDRASPEGLPAVSVLICARNERANLQHNLPALLAQDYPNWELIVVDDASSDGSGAWLDEQARQNPRLRVLHLPEGQKPFAGKKGALEAGRQAARHPVLLLSDADCRPCSNQWIRLMAERFGPQTDLVLGYGAYEQHPGWLNRFIQFETLHTLLQYASWALAGMPYMGVGRNLAVRSEALDRQGGYAVQAFWPSGDDDLMVNRMAKKGRVALCLSSSSWTVSTPPHHYAAWRKQKSRHLSTGRFYRPLHQLVLGAYSMSHFGVYACMLVVSFIYGPIPVVWGLFVLRWLVIKAVLYGLGRRFERPKLWHFSTIFDFLTMVFISTFVFKALCPKPPTWR